MDKFFGLDTPRQEEGMELLTTAHDDVELSLIQSILEGEEIPYLAEDRGGGGVLRIVMGNSMYGTDVLVPTEFIGQAREVLDAYRNAEPVEEWSDDTESEDEE